MDELRRQLALLRAPGVGPRRRVELLRRYGDSDTLFRRAPSDNELKPALRDYFAAPDWAAVEGDLAWLEAPGRHLLQPGGDDYPPLLAELPDAPLLFVHGAPALLAEPQLAMVGSRNPSRPGEETARDFARHLSRSGLVITSGLALGVDAAAHRGALDAGGQTIAVMGTGPDRIYPAANRELAHAIVDGAGALVSEFPPGTAPKAGHFPRRNRIISGLSLGVLVVEAALKSGSLITARLAMEQGREVFAIPGSIHNPLARGCHRLLRDGAKLVESGADVIEELAPQLRALLAYETAEDPPEGPPPALDSEYLQLLEAMGYESASIDTLVERSGLTAEAVSSMLLLLELQGLVASVPGGYQRTGKS